MGAGRGLAGGEGRGTSASLLAGGLRGGGDGVGLEAS